MDNAVRRRVAMGFLSSLVGRASGSIIQLVQVPVFTHFWSLPLYGEWIIVTSLPATLNFSNIGFGSVASNEMTMMVARGDRDGALRTFQSCWWLICAICAATLVAMSAVLMVGPVGKWLPLHTISTSDARWMLLALGTAVVLGQLEQLLGAAYTCIGRYAFGGLLKSMISLAAFAAMIVPVVLGHGARDTAIVFAAANVVGTLVLGWMVRRDVPWLKFGWEHARWAEIKRLALPAIAFMGMPLGNALNLQGTVLAIGYALGPTDVVIFGTARTVSRVALQMVQLVNQTFWPELGAAFGAGNIALVRTLHRRACQMAAIIALGLLVAMMTVGPYFLTRWTSHKVPPSSGLLFMLMVSVFFYSGWSTSSTLLAAINKHRTLAAYYLCGTSVTVVVTYVAAKYSGLLAAAASLILSELIMNAYVLPASLRVAEDTWGGFLRAMFDFPAMMRPANLLRRLRRGRVAAAEEQQAEI